MKTLMREVPENICPVDPGYILLRSQPSKKCFAQSGLKLAK